MSALTVPDAMSTGTCPSIRSNESLMCAPQSSFSVLKADLMSPRFGVVVVAMVPPGLVLSAHRPPAGVAERWRSADLPVRAVAVDGSEVRAAAGDRRAQVGCVSLGG